MSTNLSTSTSVNQLLGELSVVLCGFYYKEHAFQVYHFNPFAVVYPLVFGGGLPEFTHNSNLAFWFKVGYGDASGSD
jgi:hypothetical protein